jgi:hypothetical protein
MREHAVTDALTVSFQRYPYPPSGWVEALPRSRGALPLALAGPDRLLLACPAGEAFWIGLVATRRQDRSSRVGVVARLASGERVDLATGTEPAGALPPPGVAVPPRHAVEGVARPDGGWWALALAVPDPEAPACVGLELAVWTGPAAPEGRSGPHPLQDPIDQANPTSHTDPTDPTHHTSGNRPDHPAGWLPQPPGARVPPPRSGGIDSSDPAGGPLSPLDTEAPAGPPILVRVELVDAAGFEAATGRRVPGPVGDDATYGGWRLP